MSEWRLRMQAWPYSTGEGKSAEEAAVGPTDRIFTFRADDFDAAYRHSKAIQAGVASHDRVWQAPITDLTQVSP